MLRVAAVVIRQIGNVRSFATMCPRGCPACEHPAFEAATERAIAEAEREYPAWKRGTWR